MSNVYNAKLIIPVRVVADSSVEALLIAKDTARQVRAGASGIMEHTEQVMLDTYKESHATVTIVPVARDTHVERVPLWKKGEL